MSTKITKIGITSNKISGRGGLALFLRYIEKTSFYRLVSGVILPVIVNSNKGLQFHQFIKQNLAFFMDGTHMAISSFDQIKEDDGYAALLECRKDHLASSHQIKRYFHKLSCITNHIFNKILHELFFWRLSITSPQVIVLGADTMVLDNDSANKREGSEVTYKRKKGFQPLHICWGPFLIDVLFRKGSAHSNHGTDYIDRVRAVAKLIRKRYSPQVPIVLCSDSGFFDQKAFDIFEQELHIHYITTGKLYGDVTEYVRDLPNDAFNTISKDKAVWQFKEYASRLKSWSKFRRCFFTRLHRDDTGQYVMGFGKPDSIIYTNIGNCPLADERLRIAGGNEWFKAETIIRKSHQRGADELIHRSLKELATKEQLPFKSFGMNRAYYFMLVFTHFLFEAYKQDVTAEVIPATVYPNTFRRKLIDFAVRITSRARYTVLNVTKTIYETINI
ncbi:MAG: IS1380 family transposase, partial [Bacteroidales bacterium]|nr:IS1380 family transposase [Bacteroidales bacterium]